MQFSKKVVNLSKLYNIEPKDVLFAMLTAAGASAAEAFAVIYRPACSTSNALAAKASQFMTIRPGLRKLIAELEAQTQTDLSTDKCPQPRNRPGRPRKQSESASTQAQTSPALDYTDKDAVLKEYADIVVTAEKVGDKLSALNGIATLQRMKQEARVEEEKRVLFYIPLSFSKCEELYRYLSRYYSEMAEVKGDSNDLPE